jgi:hypothetical protein
MQEEGRTLIIYEFTRSKVEHGDFWHFLGKFGLDKLPTGCRLRAMRDSIVFVVDGWQEFRETAWLTCNKMHRTIQQRIFGGFDIARFHP